MGLLPKVKLIITGKIEGQIVKTSISRGSVSSDACMKKTAISATFCIRKGSTKDTFDANFKG